MICVMWLSIAVLRSVALNPLTQPGSWECQTSVWPRIFMFLACAWATIWSAAAKLNELRVPSVASHFISFSGVTALNSVSRVFA